MQSLSILIRNVQHLILQVSNMLVEDLLKVLLLKKHNIDILILGAFGCGVFKNDPTFVATIFKELLNSGYYNFKKVIFAIPQGRDRNFDTFKKVFSNE